MRVAIISKGGSSGGGAGRVAEELTDGLTAVGVSATHFSATNGKGFSRRHRSLYGPAAARAVTEVGRRAFRKLGLTEGLPIELPAMLLGGIKSNFDIVHFHDLSTAISPLTLGWFSAHMPTFWTFHDCSPFTGGCIVTGGCERFRTRCGSSGGCPQLHDWPILTRFDLTGVVQRVKARIHGTGRIHALAPSEWMADEAVSSGKVPVRPTVVSNGVDLNIFQPIADRNALRRELGLPDDRLIVLLSSGTFFNPYKGLRHAIAALKSVADLSPFVLVVGEAGEELLRALAPLVFKATGYISDPTALARYYAAADLALNCTLAESQGLTVLETMACAVPMVAFASGGVPEMILHGRSGFLVPPLDMAALTDTLRRALAPGVAARLGAVARSRAEERYSAGLFLQKHVDLYQRAIG